MPTYDPALPANNSPLSSAEMRNQLAGMKELLDALTERVSELESVVLLPGETSVSLVDFVPPDGMEISYAADKATMYDIYLQSPGDPSFVLVMAGRTETIHVHGIGGGRLPDQSHRQKSARVRPRRRRGELHDCMNLMESSGWL